MPHRGGEGPDRQPVEPRDAADRLDVVEPRHVLEQRDDHRLLARPPHVLGRPEPESRAAAPRREAAGASGGYFKTVIGGGASQGVQALVFGDPGDHQRIRLVDSRRRAARIWRTATGAHCCPRVTHAHVGG